MSSRISTIANLDKICRKLYSRLMKVQGFQPFANADARILIMGSFPSVKSRECNFYYGHPQNRFWKTLAEFFDDIVPVSVAEKKEFALRHGVALWDIVTECEITGSQDSTIKNYSVADVPSIMKNTDIKRILLNGKTAGKLFLDNFPEYASISKIMPSTSPANPRFDKSVWFQALDLSNPLSQ